MAAGKPGAAEKRLKDRNDVIPRAIRTATEKGL